MMKSFLQKWSRILFSTVKGSDLFGTQLKLLYKSNNKYKTHIGGGTTIGVIILMLVYSITQVKKLVERQAFVVNTNTAVKDLISNSEVHYPAQEGFAIAVGLKWSAEVNILHPWVKKLFELNAYEIEGYTEDGRQQLKYTPLEIEPGKDVFPYANKTILERLNINNYACIKPTDYKISGNWNGESTNFIGIFLKGGDEQKNPECLSKDEVI